MEKQIAISYPEALAFSLKMDSKEFEHEMKTMSLIKLYELGKYHPGRRRMYCQYHGWSFYKYCRFIRYLISPLSAKS